MYKLISSVILIFFINYSQSATIHGQISYDSHDTESDLVYSDVNAKHQEVRERLYRQLRQYGVPSDVAEMYVPRGLTIGELVGKGTPKPPEQDDDEQQDSTFDPWSILWYIGSFGGLIVFFLVISCSEWCCLRSRSAATLAASTAGSVSPGALRTGTARCPRARNLQEVPQKCDTPPPGYHLFAPPSYELVTEKKTDQKYNIFIVPVHNCPPPEYTEVVRH